MQNQTKRGWGLEVKLSKKEIIVGGERRGWRKKVVNLPISGGVGTDASRTRVKKGWGIVNLRGGGSSSRGEHPTLETKLPDRKSQGGLKDTSGGRGGLQ